MARLFRFGRRDTDQTETTQEEMQQPEAPATNVDLAAHMLHDAARFMRTLAHENPDLHDKMMAMSGAYDAVADLVQLDPEGEAPEGVQDLLIL